MYNHRAFIADLTSGHSTKCYHANGGVRRSLTVELMHEMELALERNGGRAERIGCGADQVRAFERLFDTNSQRLHHQAVFRGCAWNGIPILLDPSVPHDMMVWFRDGVAVGAIADLWTEAPQIHINRIEVHADDPDRLVFGLVDAFTRKVTGAIPTAFKSVAMPSMAGAPLIDGLTPEQCRERWEANAAAIESGMATPYALSPDQIAEGKRLHVEAMRRGR